MCDTMVALGSATTNGQVIFAKNSDREPSEAQILIRNPRRGFDLAQTPTVQCTYIEIPQVPETYATLLSKPAWMWGAEIGSNEFGLTIGNEAVFTKEKLGAPALTGMDMLRLALERCQSAQEALDYIIRLLADYGQGGNCGYKGKLEYHNSFLIADHQTAWVLETAGIYWAAIQVTDIYAISNGLSIGKNFDRMHPQLIENAIAKGYCKNQADFDFAKCYSKTIHIKATKCHNRRCLAEDYMRQHNGSIDALILREALRLHAPANMGKEFTAGSMGNICMHGGGIVSSQSTQSMVADLTVTSTGNYQYWLTGSSLPCISNFKPYWFASGFPLFTEEDQQAGIDYWTRREWLNRAIIAGRLDLAVLKAKQLPIQAQIDEITDALPVDADDKSQTEASRLCFKLDEDFVTEMLELRAPDQGRSSASFAAHHLRITFLRAPDQGQSAATGNLFFRRYWKKQNAILASTTSQRMKE